MVGSAGALSAWVRPCAFDEWCAMALLWAVVLIRAAVEGLALPVLLMAEARMGERAEKDGAADMGTEAGVGVEAEARAREQVGVIGVEASACLWCVLFA